MTSNPGVLFIANFGTNTGYAWNLIETYFGGLAEVAKARGFDTFACYPEISGGLPLWTTETGTKVIELNYHDRSLPNILKLLRFVKRKNIRTVYLIDQPTWSLRYFLLRTAGVKSIIIHDHTSGERRRPRGIKRLVKQMIHKTRWLSGDLFIGVSKFVVERLIDVNCVPPKKVYLVYNGVDLERFNTKKSCRLKKELNIDQNKKIIFCSARAAFYKGIHILIDAARILICEQKRSDLIFVYCGEGPDLEDFKKQAKVAGIEKCFHFLGRRDDVHFLLPCVDIVIVPSIWQEAFGLTVVEGMACGKPVVATNVGGIREIIQNDSMGILIKPNDPIDLAETIEKLVGNEEKSDYICINARKCAEKNFDIHVSISQLQKLLMKFVENC